MALQLPVVQVVGGAGAAGHVAHHEADDLAHPVAQVVGHVLEDVDVQVASLQLIGEGMPFHGLVPPCKTVTHVRDGESAGSVSQSVG